MNELALPAAAKAYIALAGSIATALLGVFTAETTVGKVLTVVAAVATGVGTWAVPNKPVSEEVTMHKHKRNEFGHAGGYYGPVGIVVLVILILILLAVTGVIG